MDILMDKIIISILCVAFYIPNTSYSPIIVPILAAVIISALLSYFDNDIARLSGFAGYVILCTYNHEFLFFIPLVCYDVLFSKYKWIWLLAFLPMLVNFKEMFLIINILIIHLYNCRTDKVSNNFASNNKNGVL